MDTVAPEHTNVLRNNIRAYLNRIVYKQPIYVGDWDRTFETYTNIRQAFLKDACTCPSMQHMHITIDLRDDITDPATQEERINIIATRAILSNELKTKMTKCVRSKHCRSIVLTVRFLWRKLPNMRYNAHIAMILFDLKNRVQIFFDPACHLWTRAFCEMQEPLIPGFRVATYNECKFLTQNSDRLDGLQRYFEDGMDGDNEQGQCGLHVTLVLMCCVRFNILNPKVIAEAMVKAFHHHDSNARHTFIRKFISFYTEAKTANASRMRELLNPNIPTNPECPDVGCSVLCPSGKLCLRSSCKESMYGWCWQHHKQLGLGCTKKRQTW